jgi:Sigma-70, region 4
VAGVKHMSRLDELPPDQRAALSLLLNQRKSYAAVAAMLDIPQRAVHDRAHAALAVLAPGQARAVPAERRMEIGDYMLGQQPGVAERLSTRAFLGDSEAGRAWARGLAAELAPLAGAALPDIPSSQPGNQPAAPASAGKTAGANGGAQEPSSEAGHDTASARMAASLPSSRLGGAVLLGAILAGVIVAVVLLAGGGGGSHPKRTVASSTATSANSKASTGASGPKIDNRLTLKSPSSSSAAIGAVEILSEGGKRAFYMAAEHLAPSKGFSYVIWLYNSPTSFEGLSKAPAVSSDGRLVGGALLPSNAGSYHEILITRETTSRPAKPGTIVLRGPFSLGG